jgi:hypothetical protein
MISGDSSNSPNDTGFPRRFMMKNIAQGVTNGAIANTSKQWKVPSHFF